MIGISLSRWWAIVRKEFIQLKRDRPTFGMIIGIPIMQLLLFGYAINTNPKHLPTALVSADSSSITRSAIAGLQHSEYFRFVDGIMSEEAAKRAIERGDVQFILSIPTNFTRDALRGEKPKMLLQADATDPTAISHAISTATLLPRYVAAKDFTGPLHSLIEDKEMPYSIEIQRLYNPEINTQYNIIPGLMGLVLTMTLVMMTAVAITRERERGTMENLLAMPVKPIEVICGKLIPYIMIGLIQSSIILFCAYALFHIPFQGSLSVLFAMILLFIIGNLTLGITLSSFARNQMQAIQLTIFILLPSLLLSGFMFPFLGMPQWAQRIGNIIPLTYFVRVARGIMLKANGWVELWQNIWPLLIFMAAMMGLGVKLYRKTLD